MLSVSIGNQMQPCLPIALSLRLLLAKHCLGFLPVCISRVASALSQGLCWVPCSVHLVVYYATGVVFYATCVVCRGLGFAHIL